MQKQKDIGEYKPLPNTLFCLNCFLEKRDDTTL